MCRNIPPDICYTYLPITLIYLTGMNILEMKVLLSNTHSMWFHVEYVFKSSPLKI